MSHGYSKPVVTGMDGGLGCDQSRLVMTGFLQFFAVSVRSFGYFLLWLTGHGHGLPKMGPKTVTGPDLKALCTLGKVMDNCSHLRECHGTHGDGDGIDL